MQNDLQFRIEGVEVLPPANKYTTFTQKEERNP